MDFFFFFYPQINPIRLSIDFRGYVVRGLLTPLHSLAALPDHISSWLGLNLLWINFSVPADHFCIETNQYNPSETFRWNGDILNSNVFLYRSSLVPPCQHVFLSAISSSAKILLIVLDRSNLSMVGFETKFSCLWVYVESHFLLSLM